MMPLATVLSFCLPLRYLATVIAGIFSSISAEICCLDERMGLKI